MDGSNDHAVQITYVPRYNLSSNPAIGLILPQLVDIFAAASRGQARRRIRPSFGPSILYESAMHDGPTEKPAVSA